MNKTRPISTDSTVWTPEALDRPHDEADKAQRVNTMFAAIAESYDLNNRVHSLWRDQAWRRKGVTLARVKPGTDDIVDVACGTGDLSLAFARAHPASVTGIDFVPKMVELATAKGARAQPDLDTTSIHFMVGDAMNLPLADACADVVSIAFGIRNVSDPDQALSEFRRILRPGGRLLILEFGLPSNPVLRGLYNFYFNRIMPWTATLISRDRTGAYKYLPRSVNTFIPKDEMLARMANAGFGQCACHPLTFGVCLAYLGAVSGNPRSQPADNV
ncbi:MAG: ubiquinone/menaquinone biosynthesis methyltransferase [Planctomycetes bacterium]|nr:ubiquinone/menaquinone biosynthesis methyltransferase [Planctomycetota bacterium]